MNTESERKILYVEDELFLGKIVKESLENKGYNVRMVSDGKLVLAAYQQFQPDICVLDIMLPNVDGYQLAREIKTADQGMPVIFLTAKTQTKDVLEGFSAGGNDYLRKPFSVEELIARIENLLKLKSLPGSNNFDLDDNLVIGNYTFYPHKYELDSPTQKHKLSNREKELLEIFATNQNQLIHRNDILNKVWKDDSFFNSRTLDVYIKKIRNYLKEDAALQIKTVKGVGYLFVTK
jgi:DNA-binding response OmpR family regulator